MIALKTDDAVIPLRDRFAYLALNGLLSCRGTDRKPVIIGRNSYELADAMMAARGSAAGAEDSLRDHIAGLALNGLLVCEGTIVKPTTTARLAFEMADAVLAARAGN